MVYRSKNNGTSSQAELLILAPSPSPIVDWDADRIERYKNKAVLDVPFSDKAEKIVMQVVKKQAEKRGFSKNIAFWYGINCRVWKPTIDAIEKCSQFLSDYLEVVKPRVIVPLGTAAMKALQMKGQEKTDRGLVQNIELFGKEYKVVPSFHPVSLKKKPGLLETFEKELDKAFDIFEFEDTEEIPLEVLTKDYKLPKTVEEVEEVVEEILSYEKNGQPTPISVDIETNSLHPQEKTAKSICISFAWDEGKAATIILDHYQASRSYLRQLPRIYDLVNAILKSDRLKIGHNFKFDWKFLVLLEGFTINRFEYDTMLMAHLLNEDRGSYSLKELVREYFPEFANYEEATDAVKKSSKAKKKWFPKFSTKTYPDTIRYLRGKDKKLVYLCRALYEVSYNVTRSFLLPLEDMLCKELTFEDLPIDEMSLYAAIDADVTWRLAKKQLTQLPKDNGDKAKLVKALEEELKAADTEEEKEKIKVELSKHRLLKDLFKDHVIPMSKIMSELEFNGFRLDMKKADQWIEEAYVAMNELRDKINEYAGEDVNINHAGDLARILYSKLGLPVIKKTPGGAPSTDVETLELLLKKTNNEVLRALMEYRDAKSCYEKVMGYRRAALIDGYVHTDFNIFGTSTGRLSSGKKDQKDKSQSVNLQNIVSRKAIFGKKLKELYIPSDPENMNIGNMDLGTAEVMVLTAYAPDPTLIQAILDGLDCHIYTATQLYHISYEEFEDKYNREKMGEKIEPVNGLTYKTMRTNAKEVTFGVAYGKKEYTLSQDLGVSKEEAKVILDSYFQRFPIMKKYQDQTINEAKRKGYVDTYFGRKRRLPILKVNSRDWHSQNQSINFKVQSTAADMLNAQLIEMAVPLREELGGRLIAQVHDSVVFEYSKKIPNEKVKEFFDYYITQRIAEKFPWMPVPMKLDIEIGPNYGNLSEL
jgi:uracil-DNA glycosylase family 4